MARFPIRTWCAQDDFSICFPKYKTRTTCLNQNATPLSRTNVVPLIEKCVVLEPESTQLRVYWAYKPEHRRHETMSVCCLTGMVMVSPWSKRKLLTDQNAVHKSLGCLAKEELEVGTNQGCRKVAWQQQRYRKIQTSTSDTRRWCRTIRMVYTKIQDGGDSGRWEYQERLKLINTEEVYMLDDRCSEYGWQWKRQWGWVTIETAAAEMWQRGNTTGTAK